MGRIRDRPTFKLSGGTAPETGPGWQQTGDGSALVPNLLGNPRSWGAGDPGLHAQILDAFVSPEGLIDERNKEFVVRELTHIPSY
jgi:hypothetical protein